MPAEDVQKTGVTGPERDTQGRYRKGMSGNPAGRPVGSIRPGERLAMEMLEGASEALMRKAIDMALDGDPAAMRLCLDRIVAARRGRGVALSLPEMKRAEDLAEAMQMITVAATVGAITPDEARSLSQMFESYGRTLVAAHRERVRLWKGNIWYAWTKRMQRGNTDPVVISGKKRTAD
jgi:hypothetical protein